MISTQIRPKCISLTRCVVQISIWNLDKCRTMSSKRISPTMLPTRKRTSVEAPRHIPRTVPQAPNLYTTQMPIVQPNYATVSGPIADFPAYPACYPYGDNFYSPNDGSYIPASAVAPMDLSCWEVNTSQTSSSGSSSLKSLSPPMSEAEMLHCDVYPTADDHLGMDQFSQYPDPWLVPGCPPTPPPDPMFDIPDMFNTGKADLTDFNLLPDTATECEYLGVSKLQFSRSSDSVGLLLTFTDYVSELCPDTCTQEQSGLLRKEALVTPALLDHLRMRPWNGQRTTQGTTLATMSRPTRTDTSIVPTLPKHATTNPQSRSAFMRRSQKYMASTQLTRDQ